MSTHPPVVVVTGASSGIGKACADRLHHRGWQVIGASRRGAGTDSVGWTPLVMDVDEDDSVASGVDELVTARGRLDAVVACAGWGLAGPVETTALTDARDQMETNFWGVVRVVARALPVMRDQGTGRIVVMSSIGGILGLPFQAYYCASKFALEGWAESLAYEVGPLGIAVTLVEPGNVATAFTDQRRSVGPSAHDPYEPAAATAVGKMARDEHNGVAPDLVAATVERVLTARRPPRRASVGRLDERVGIVGKRLLPYRLFEKAAKGSLGV